MNITEDYCSFEISKLLEEKGFPQTRILGDFITNMVYKVKANEDGSHSLFLQCPERVYNKDRYIAAPTIQMAMKWLRFHNWTISVEPKEFLCDLVVKSWGYKVWADATLEVNMSETYQAYNNACEAAIKYCLTNLI